MFDRIQALSNKVSSFCVMSLTFFFLKNRNGYPINMNVPSTHHIIYFVHSTLEPPLSNKSVKPHLFSPSVLLFFILILDIHSPFFFINSLSTRYCPSNQRSPTTHFVCLPINLIVTHHIILPQPNICASFSITFYPFYSVPPVFFTKVYRFRFIISVIIRKHIFVLFVLTLHVSLYRKWWKHCLSIYTNIEHDLKKQL